MRDEAAEPVSDLEQEGIPEMETPYPGEAATGVRWDDVMAPGDEPVGVDEFGITPAEERMDEPLAVRVRREEPDVVTGAGAGDTATDLGGAVVEDLADAAGGVSGRIVEPDQGWIGDEEPDLVGGEALGDDGVLAAEESAMHVVAEDDVPGISWDASPGYLEDEDEPTG